MLDTPYDKISLLGYFILFHLNVGFDKGSVKHSYNFDVMKLSR